MSCRNEGHNSPPVVANSTNSPVKDSLADAKKKEPATAAKPKTTPVKSFAFENPSPDWKSSDPAQGSGTLTQATLKSSNSPAKMTVISIGLPVSTKEAAALVNTSENGFSQGYAKHPELTREWIKSGFAISRFADPASGQVLIWSSSETCKIQLKFEFGQGSNPKDNIKSADKSTDDFFEKNPTGGAKLN